MPFKPNEFLGSLNKTGVARASNFEVQITPGPNVPRDSGTERNMVLRADSAEIPGRTISTNEYKVYGPIRKVAYADTYTDSTIGFLCSEDLIERDYFENWQNSVIYHTINKGGMAFKSGGVQSNIGYYREYVGTVEIRQYDEPRSLRSVYTLNEAYPIGIAPIGVAWNSGDLIRLNVTFAYRDYTMEILPPSSENKPKPQVGISGSINIGGINVGGNFNKNGTSNLSVGGFKVPVSKIPK